MFSETMKTEYVQPRVELFSTHIEYALMAGSGNKKFDTGSDTGGPTPPGPGDDDDNPVGPSQSKGYGSWDSDF